MPYSQQLIGATLPLSLTAMYCNWLSQTFQGIQSATPNSPTVGQRLSGGPNVLPDEDCTGEYAIVCMDVSLYIKYRENTDL